MFEKSESQISWTKLLLGHFAPNTIKRATMNQVTLTFTNKNKNKIPNIYTYLYQRIVSCDFVVTYSLNLHDLHPFLSPD